MILDWSYDYQDDNVVQQVTPNQQQNLRTQINELEHTIITSTTTSLSGAGSPSHHHHHHHHHHYLSDGGWLPENTNINGNTNTTNNNNNDDVDDNMNTHQTDQTVSGWARWHNRQEPREEPAERLENPPSWAVTAQQASKQASNKTLTVSSLLSNLMV